LAAVTSDSNLSSSVPCALCSNDRVEIVGDQDRDGRPLRVVLCPRCGLVWNDPRPGAEELAGYYRDEYRRDYKQTLEPRQKHTLRAARVAAARCREVGRHLKPGAQVLDLGAGGGEVVYVLRRLGFEARGIEPNEGYARFARERLGLPVESGFWQQAPVAPASEDAVTLFHVLEHLDDPVGALTLVRGWLRKDGLLWVEVPNIAARCIAPAHRFHRAHLFGFSPSTLAGIGKRAGFRVERIFTSPDGGNVTGVFRRSETVSDGPFEDPTAAGDVRQVLKGHTPLRHLFTTAPYLRPVRKIVQAVGEFFGTRGTPEPRTLLERALTREGLATAKAGGVSGA
jgi:SAM-dependent methyltransferase